MGSVNLVAGFRRPKLWHEPAAYESFQGELRRGAGRRPAAGSTGLTKGDTGLCP
jgi:hypothetical protein